MDHPRVGGEKPNRILWDNFKRGSPPRGRGKVRILPLTRSGFRITPAWAGKSAGERQRPPCPQDHPRVGGEKLGLLGGAGALVGSPPRGRGKDKPLPISDIPVGITPAWAGKSCLLRFFHLLIRDHPRVGGEKTQQHSKRTMQTGSPPRGRGKGTKSVVCCQCRGITPAWAGKSRFVLSSPLAA